MATNRRQPQRKQGDDTKRADLNPLKLPPDTRKRQDGWTELDDPFESEDIPPDPPRQPTSAIRYQQPTGGLRGMRERDDDPDTTRQHIQAPSRRTSKAYNGLPGPTRVRAGRNTTLDMPQPHKAPPSRSMHWLLYVGVGMIAALALWLVFSSLLAWGVSKYNDIKYGYPRFYQTDAVVGHSDSAAHPSHFVALNLHGQVIVIELPGGNPAKSFDYVGPSMIASGDDLIPITLTFNDVHHNGKPDMFIHIQDRDFFFCNDGTKFVACSTP
ncbi:MAG TPA: hypothetical protein VFQ36_03620 [Ktedonobacteraceae bacterium]|nr:hypothetical protein [Ktedonobacteraceae bacterium]